MNYTKPEVSTLGNATTVIEFNGVSKPAAPPHEIPYSATLAPAYDLDE